MKANTKNNNPITMNGETLEETYSFTYPGSTINKNGGTEEDVKARIQKARGAFIMLRTIWRAKQIKTNTNLRIFNSNVKAVLLFGSETWRSIQKTLKRIQGRGKEVDHETPAKETRKKKRRRWDAP